MRTIGDNVILVSVEQSLFQKRRQSRSGLDAVNICQASRSRAGHRLFSPGQQHLYSFMQSVEEFRQAGNSAFARKDFLVAIDHYTQAILRANDTSTRHTLYTNRQELRSVVLPGSYHV